MIKTKPNLLNKKTPASRHEEERKYARSSPDKMKASEVRRLSKEERTKYMIEHSTQAEHEYREHPELLIDGGNELLSY